MTQLQVHEEPTLSSESIKSGFEHFMEGFEQFMEGVQTLLTRLAQAYEQAERNYHRAELLTAYRQRTSWKKSDIPRLSTLGINAVARRRMERVTGTGRPVVKSHEDLASVIVRKISSVQALFASQASTSADRRKAFRLSPWWAHCVESMYRGEHALAKACRIADASGQAESAVAHALRISPSSVHYFCGTIRRLRREDPDAANFPAITVAEFEAWMSKGQIPPNLNSSAT